MSQQFRLTCPECQKNGVKSKTKLVRFIPPEATEWDYDEDGNNLKDWSILRAEFTCSNSHFFIMSKTIDSQHVAIRRALGV